MSIYDLKQGKRLVKIGKKMGREEIAKRAIAIAEQIIRVDSYKNAVAGIGRMVALASCVRSDCYWSEKMSKGKEREYNSLIRWDESGDYYPMEEVI